MEGAAANPQSIMLLMETFLYMNTSLNPMILRNMPLYDVLQIYHTAVAIKKEEARQIERQAHKHG
mgnify:CR=1 FL=1